jgi:single-strand DNA-binding protein
VSTSVNRVVLLGHLARDPELRSLPGGDNVCSLRIVVKDRVKNATTGAWHDSANYFDVEVSGSQGESCGKWLSKGREVAIDGRLRWRGWETPDGWRCSAVSIVADNVEFIGAPDDEGSAGGRQQVEDETRADLPADAIYAEDDDIPF